MKRRNGTLTRRSTNTGTREMTENSISNKNNNLAEVQETNMSVVSAIQSMSDMFLKLINQMKNDHKEVVELLNDKFSTQLLQLQDQNANLIERISMLEKQLLSSKQNNIAISTSRRQAMQSSEENATSSQSNIDTPLLYSQAINTVNLNRNQQMANKNRKYIKGTGLNCSKASNIKSAPKKSYPSKLFLSRLDVDTAPTDLQAHIQTCCELKIDLEKFEKLPRKFPNQTYSSFVITAIPDQIDTLLNGNNWPEHVIVKKYFEPSKNKSTAQDTPSIGAESSAISTSNCDG